MNIWREWRDVDIRIVPKRVPIKNVKIRLLDRSIGKAVSSQSDQ